MMLLGMHLFERYIPENKPYWMLLNLDLGFYSNLGI